MSNYCKACDYDFKRKYGENACPFNSLYWHFFERHRDKFIKNPRVSIAYRNLDRMVDSEKRAILEQAETYLQQLEQL